MSVLTAPDRRRAPANGRATAGQRPWREASRTLAGGVLVGLSTLPALLAMAWLVVACPLAVVGLFRPAVAVPLAVAVAAAVVPLVSSRGHQLMMPGDGATQVCWASAGRQENNDKAKMMPLNTPITRAGFRRTLSHSLPSRLHKQKSRAPWRAFLSRGNSAMFKTAAVPRFRCFKDP